MSGISWGTMLALAYAQAHPERVTEMVPTSVVTTTRAEVEWLTRAMGRVVPEQWERFRDAVPPQDRDGDLAAAYSRLLHDEDPQWGGAPGRHPRDDGARTAGRQRAPGTCRGSWRAPGPAASWSCWRTLGHGATLEAIRAATDRFVAR